MREVNGRIGLTIEGTKEFLSMVTTGANIAAKCRRISDI